MIGSPSADRPTIETRSPQAGVALVVLGGEHDLASAPEVEQALDRCLDIFSHLIVDLSVTTFLDSSTIAVLLRAKRRADEADHKFSLVVGGAPIVECVLEVSGVLPTLNVVATVEQALGV